MSQISAPLSHSLARPRSSLLSLLASQRLLLTAATVILLLALVLGGGTRQSLLPDAVVQVLSLPLLALAILHLWMLPASSGAKWPIVLLVGTLVLPIVQMLPLPPAFWSILPGRAPFAANYALAAMPVPWLPISLDAAATWNGVVALLPPVAIFLASLSLAPKDRRSLTLLIIGFGLASFILGLAQIFQGPASGLRFHAITNPNRAVGFFANSNHFASLLYCVMPLTAAWAVALFQDHRPDKLLGLFMCLAVFACVILGLGIAGSRSGLFLTFLAGLGAFAIVWLSATGGKLRNRAMGAMALASLLGVLAIVQFTLFELLRSTERSLVEDARAVIYKLTAGMATDFFPAGSGLGTFDRIYQMYETPTNMRSELINHAHNDWLELWLETGLPGLVLLGGFLVWYFAAGRRVWRAPDPTARLIDISLARAGWIVLGLLLLHSGTDYPLRTTAQSTVFAFCCALMIRSSRASADVAEQRPAPRSPSPKPEPRPKSHVRGRRRQDPSKRGKSDRGSSRAT